MYQKIYEFNKIRNNFKWDPQLEIDMFEEEKCEFFMDSKTLADRVDAYCDCEYVHFGTKMKMAANNISTMPYVADLSIMYHILQNEIDGSIYSIGDYYAPTCENHTSILGIILTKAMKIVCECNALKIAKLDANGKVMKQKNLPNATELITVMIEKEFARRKDA